MLHIALTAPRVCVLLTHLYFFCLLTDISATVTPIDVKFCKVIHIGGLTKELCRSYQIASRLLQKAAEKNKAAGNDTLFGSWHGTPL